jgi:peptide/nickel transport system substrate-binding protein
MKGICFDYNVACRITQEPVKYDQAQAKRLLAEAGYANGFDMTYDCHIPIKDVCEAIAGELRKVNVRASVTPTPLQLFRKKQSDGELQAYSVFYPTPVFPDAGALLSVFFEGERDYARDPKMTEWMAQGLKEFDLAKRTAIYEQALNWNNEQAYMLAFSSMGTAYAHTKDVQILKDPVVAGDIYINGYAWK